MDDRALMARALELAQRGLYTTMPNPRVGCVIAREGVILGEGWTQPVGQNHAEIEALADAARRGSEVRGATVYVTLEPCCHTGRTPPCTDALIAAGVGKVVMAMRDPNPRVAGGGVAALATAGIDTALLDEFSAPAEALNAGFCRRMRSGLPLLRVKSAMSLDGRTAMASGESQWITGAAARREVQRLRAQSCAILSGIGTLLQDDAALTVRAAELDLDDAQRIARRQPLRVVVDSTLRLPPTARLLQQPGRVLLVAASADSSTGFAERRAALQAAGAEVLVLAGGDGRVDLRALLQELARRECNEVLVEAGAVLTGALWQQGLIDQWWIYMAPVLLGSSARPLLDWPLETLAGKGRLIIDGVTPVGDDWRIVARPAAAEQGMQT